MRWSSKFRKEIQKELLEGFPFLKKIGFEELYVVEKQGELLHQELKTPKNAPLEPENFAFLFSPRKVYMKRLLSHDFEVIPPNSEFTKGPRNDWCWTVVGYGVEKTLYGAIILLSKEVPDEEENIIFAASHLKKAANKFLVQRLQEEIKEGERKFKTFYNISLEISSTRELSAILQNVVDSVARKFEAEICIIELVEDDRLVIKAAHGLAEEEIEAMRTTKIGESLTGRIAENGKPLYIKDLSKCKRFKFKKIGEKAGFKTFLGAPITYKGLKLGAISVLTKRSHMYYTDDDKELLEAIGSIIGVSIDNADVYKELNKKITELEAFENQVKAYAAEIETTNRKLRFITKKQVQFFEEFSRLLRTPLTVTYGYMSLIKRKSDSLPDSLKTLIGAADAQIKKLGTLVNNLLLFWEESLESESEFQSMDWLNLSTLINATFEELDWEKNVERNLYASIPTSKIKRGLTLLAEVVQESCPKRGKLSFEKKGERGILILQCGKPWEWFAEVVNAEKGDETLFKLAEADKTGQKTKLFIALKLLRSGEASVRMKGESLVIEFPLSTCKEESERKAIALAFNPRGKIPREFFEKLHPEFYVSEKRDVLEFYHELASSSPDVTIIVDHPPYTADLLEKIENDPRFSRILTVVVDPKTESLSCDLTVSSSEPEKAKAEILERLGGKI